MSFVKLKHLYEQPIFAPVNGLESFAGFHGLGVQHNRIWTPEPEKLFKVIPERYHKDFKLTRMSINSVLIPHVDNDLISTINFYFQPENYRTIFYKAKPNASSWKTEEKQLQKLDGPKLRKAFALRTTKYDYREVYEMLEETGNL